MAQTVANLDEHVREQLRSRIINGDLSGGAHLSELKISKEFNVSRTPVREALCALAADGLIEMVPHRGAFVRTVSQNELEDQRFIYGNLMALATRMAVERAGIETMMDMETALTFMNDQTGEAFTNACASVNAAIIQAAQSSTLEEALDMVQRRMIVDPMSLSESSDIDAIKQEYSFLMGAFKRQKADSAEKTMRQLMALFSTQDLETEEQTSQETPQVN